LIAFHAVFGGFLEFLFAEKALSTVSGLFTCMNAVFSPVIWLHLSPPNYMGKQLLFEHTERFLQDYAYFTKCHLHAHRGYELGNTHEHILLSVPNTELSMFYRRYSQFDEGKAWKWQINMKLFDPLLEERCHGYIAKHQLVMPDQSPDMYCGKYLHQCRKGNCKYQPR
jgi:hypothetical protein